MITRAQDFTRNLTTSSEAQIEIAVRLSGDAAAAVDQYKRRWNGGEKKTATQIANELILIAIDALTDDDEAGHPISERSGKPKATEPKFEKDLEKLESLVEALEEGGLSLEDSLRKFEEGIKLSKRCEKALSTAEKRIESLTKDAGGKINTSLFTEEDDDSDVDEDEGDEGDEEEEDEEGLLF